MRLFKKGHNSQTHIIIGLVVILILNYLNKLHPFIIIPQLTILDYAIILFIIFAYSQMPDIDQSTSRISRLFMVVGLSVIAYTFINGEKTIGLMATGILLFVRLTTHRTIIHSAFIGFLLSLPLYFIKPTYAYVAFVSFLVHIISEGEFSLFTEKDWKVFK